MILIALLFEGGVDVAVGRGGAQNLERLRAWGDSDELRRRIVLGAAELQSRAGVSATDAQLARLAEALRPALVLPDPLRVRAPWGSFQNRTLRQIVGAERGRKWLSWAVLQPCGRERLLEPETSDPGQASADG
jgi:hypothetical protein